VKEQFVFIANDGESGILAAQGPGTQEQAIEAAENFAATRLNTTLDNNDLVTLDDEGFIEVGNNVLSVVRLTPFGKK